MKRLRKIKGVIVAGFFVLFLATTAVAQDNYVLVLNFYKQTDLTGAESVTLGSVMAQISSWGNQISTATLCTPNGECFTFEHPWESETYMFNFLFYSFIFSEFEEKFPAGTYTLDCTFIDDTTESTSFEADPQYLECPTFTNLNSGDTLNRIIALFMWTPVEGAGWYQLELSAQGFPLYRFSQIFGSGITWFPVFLLPSGIQYFSTIWALVYNKNTPENVYIYYYSGTRYSFSTL